MRLSTRLIASGAVGSVSGVLAVCAMLVLAALPAHAQSAQTATSHVGDFKQPYDFSYGQNVRPIDGAAQGQPLTQGARWNLGGRSTAN